MEIRNASKQDARDLAVLINMAGEGIPEYLWTPRRQGDESPMDVGAQRAARSEGTFSYKNARTCMDGEELLGMVLSYWQPDPYEIEDLASLPDVIQPLVELESGAPGSWYINAIATFEQHRGKGVGRMLMDDAESQARSRGCDRMSLIVASENTGAKKLYEMLGYQDVDSRPVVAFPGFPHDGDWVLMVKQLDSAQA